MARILEIPKERWSSFLQTINRLAGGRPVRLEVARRELGDQEMAELLPLTVPKRPRPARQRRRSRLLRPRA